MGASFRIVSPISGRDASRNGRRIGARNGAGNRRIVLGWRWGCAMPAHRVAGKGRTARLRVDDGADASEMRPYPAPVRSGRTPRRCVPTRRRFARGGRLGDASRPEPVRSRRTPRRCVPTWIRFARGGRRGVEENRGRGRLDAVQPRSTTVERPADQHFSIGGGASKSGSKSGSQIARIDEGGSDSDRDSDFAALHEVAADTLRIMANGPAARLTACCCHVNVFASPEHQALRPDNSEKTSCFHLPLPLGEGRGEGCGLRPH